MTGSTKNHNNIIVNLTVAIKTNKKPGCDVFIDGMKLEIEENQFYVYPDLVYTCNDNLKGGDLYVTSHLLFLKYFLNQQNCMIKM